MSNKGKFARFKKGDTILIGDRYTKPYQAVVDHFNSIGQPYVFPEGARSPVGRRSSNTTRLGASPNV
jgi:hypothetical protein